MVTGYPLGNSNAGYYKGILVQENLDNMISFP